MSKTRAIKVESCNSCPSSIWKKCELIDDESKGPIPESCLLPAWPSLSRRDIEDWARLSGTIDSLIIKLKSIGVEVKEVRDGKE